MEERTITINGMSKTYSVTGWRVGWTIGPPRITDAIRKVHDFLTVGAPAPPTGSRGFGVGHAGKLLREARGRISQAARPAGACA